MNRRWIALGTGLLLLSFWLLMPLPAQEGPSLRRPEPLPGGGWRLVWSGESGRTYRLERAASLPAGTGPDWQPVTTVTATNGLIVADDLIAPDGQTRFYRAVPVTEPSRLRVGSTDLFADAVSTNGPEVILTGSVRAGIATLRPTTPVTVNLATRRLSATGSVDLIGGASLTGTFIADLDASTLTVAGDPAPFNLGEWLGLDPRELTVDLTDGGIRGNGLISIRLANLSGSKIVRAADANAEAVLDGAFETGSETNTLNFAGTASFRDVTAEGIGTIDLPTGAFSLTGKVRVPGAGGLPYLLEPGRFSLSRPPDLPAVFSVTGQSALAPAGTGQLAGTLQLDGSLALSWTGPAEVGALRFPRLTVRLNRPGVPGAVASLRFEGPLELPRVGGTELKGAIQPDGSTTNLTSLAPLQLGSLNIRPRSVGEVTIPVLTLIRSEVNRQTLRVQGEFLTPEEHGVQPVRMNGELVLSGGTAGLDIESMHITNELPIPQWPLPQRLRLTNFSLRLTFTNADFEARLRGGLLLAIESNRPTRLELDTALAANVNDPADLGIDAALRVQSLNLKDRVFVTDAQFRMLVGTKPAFGALALVNGSAGMFPKFSGTNIPANPQRSNFHLFAGGVGASVTLSENGLNLSLTNGFLQLPLLFTNQPPGLCPDNSSGTSIGLGRDTAITVAITGPAPDDLTVRAQGSLNFTNIALLPQLNGFATELCRASLVFNPGGLPYLTNLQGVAVFPFPKGQTNRVELLNGAWSLDGFPTGTIALMSNLTLHEGHGFRFTLLGRNTTNSLCTNGVALTAVRDADGGLPTLVLDGASELILPANLVTEVGGDFVRHVNCARITLPGHEPFLPRLDVKAVAFGGTFHLGGDGGFLLTNSLFTIRNLDNMFEPTVAEPFVLELSGTLAVPNGPAFTLKEARLTQTSRDQPPQFTVAGMGYSENEFTLAQKIPARVTAASFEFKDRAKSLPDLLKPANVNLRFSVLAAIPSTEKKLFEGTVKDLKLTVKGDGMPAIEDVDGFSMLINGLKLPPISDIGGGVLVSGLSRAAGVNRTGPARAGLFGGDLDDLFYAGTVEGSYQGYKLKLILAFRSTGIVGACLDFNAGNVGIPIDGGYLGGVLLTGASGGVVLGNGFNDPCEFTAYLGPDGKPKPGVTELPKITISWEDLQKKLTQAEEQAEKFNRLIGNPSGVGPDGGAADPLADLFANGLTDNSAGIARASIQRASVFPHVRSTNEFGLPCPGDCPPPTINIFCQPHPDQDRFPKVVIARFSSVSEETLNGLGFTRAWVASRFSQGNDWATRMALAVAAGIRTNVLARTPLPTVENLGPAAAELLGIINDNAARLEAALVPLVVDAIANEANAGAVYDKLVAVVYRGAPCPDITLSVSGTFTHTAVSSFLSGTVGAAISTAGVAGVSGHINLLGVPVGNAKAFVAATDERADPNPSVCAEVDVEVGPLSLGTMRGSYALQGAVTGLANAWTRLLECVSEPLLFEVVRRVAPRVTVTGRTKLAVADDLTPQEKVGVIAQLYSRPGLPGELRDCVAAGLSTLMAEVNPEILFCGEVRPRLFGFPLGADLVTAGMQATKTNFVAVTAGSPAMMMATTLLSVSSVVGTGAVGVLAGPLSATLFAPDRATVGYALNTPDPAEPFLGGIQGRFNSPGAVIDYLDTTFDQFLENATYTVDYTLSPLGFKTFDAQARIVLPNLTAHPALPGSGWVLPENRGLNLPSRLDLLLSALTNRMPGSSLGLIADPQWKGSAGDLGRAFAAGSPEQARVAGLSFANDYFPHGGLLGGGYIQLPRALYEAPPPALFTALNPTNDAFTRLGAAAEYILDYVLQSRQAGALGFYIPAPNPPVFTAANGSPLKPRALLDSIRGVRPELPGFGQLYPGGLFFLRGYLDGQLLGIPVVKATLEARLADPSTGTNAYFRAAGNVPAGSWLDAFSPGASVEFEMRGAPPESIETVFSNRLNQALSILTNSPGQAAAQAQLAAVIADLQDGLPKVKLEAALPLQMPAPISDLVRLSGDTRLFAYSPAYEPNYSPASTNPVARARRQGGLAMRGQVDFRLEGANLASLASGELLVTPQSGVLPRLEGSFSAPLLNVGSLTLRDANLDFTSAAASRYGARGRLSPFAIGSAFRIEPLAGTDLSARLEVTRVGTRAAGQLFLTPSRLQFGSTGLLLHGGQRTNEFSFSSTGPWSATIEITNQIELKTGNITVLRLARNALVNPVSASGVGLSSLEFTANLTSGGGALTFFPDTTFAQTFTYRPSAAAQITVRSDGTFRIVGTLDTDGGIQGLPQLPVSKLSAGAAFTVTEAGLIVDGRLGGGLLTQLGGPSLTVNGRFTLSPTGAAGLQTSSLVSIPPLGNSFLSLQGNAGGPMTASVGNTGLSFSGVKLQAAELFTNSVPAFTADSQGNFVVAVGPSGSSFGRWSFSSLSYRLLRTNGVISVTNVAAVTANPALGSSLSFTGHISANGTVDLRASRTDGALGGYQVGALDVALQRAIGNVRSAIAANAPLAYWRLGETGKTTAAVSETGDKFLGAYQPGVTLGETGALAGDANSAVRLDGKTGCVIIGNESLFDTIGSSITLEAWFRVGAFDRTWNTIIAKGDSAWRLQRNANSDTLAFDTDGLNPPYLAGTRPVNDGRWHHVIASYNGRVKSLWIDGELDAWTPATGTIARNDHPVMIGENAQSTGRFWNGWLDEVAIYREALSPTDLLNHLRSAGNLTGSASFRSSLPNLGTTSLDGSFSADGAVALFAHTASQSLGGFSLTDPKLHFYRAAGGSASLLADGDLSFLGLPPIRLVGGINSAGVMTLTGSIASGPVLGFGFTDLNAQLTGGTSVASISLGGNLAIGSLGTLNFAGTAAANGDLSLTNRLTSNATVFGYPVTGGQYALRREGRTYRSVLTGDPLVALDRGDDPRAYWRLGELVGATVSDSKKVNVFNPALSGTYVGGVTLGQAGALAGDANPSASFDGVNDYVEIANESAFDDLTGRLTVEVWMKSPGWTRTWETLVSKGDSSWRLSRFNNTRQVSFDTSSAAGAHSLVGVSNLDDNRWHHVVGVYDGYAKCLYVDGILEAFAPYRQTLLVNDYPVRLGENAQATGRYFRGQLDEVAIFSRALSPLEVLDHFRAAGGAGIDVALRFAIPGLGGVDTVGMLHPSGALSMQAAAGSTIPANGFSLGSAVMTVTRTSAGSVNGLLGGSVSTPFGSLVMAGLIPANGNYRLESVANGTLPVGDRTLTFTVPAKLEPIGFEAAGTLQFGDFTFTGAAKVTSTQIPSFGGSISRTTPAMPFGRKLDGSPGHPYAWLSWTASASYDASSRIIKASVGGNFTVEYEVFPGNTYRQETVGFGPLTLPTDGRITVKPANSYPDYIHSVKITDFPFDLP